MIKFVDGDTVGHECVACGTERTLHLHNVHVRPMEEPGAPASVLELPACPRCGSTEVLVPASARQGASEPADARLPPHQLMVEILAVHAGLAASTPELEAAVAAVFPDGVRLHETSARAAAQ